MFKVAVLEQGNFTKIIEQETVELTYIKGFEAISEDFKKYNGLVTLYN